MATEYCDPWTYAQVYGHEPPTDGSYDPALGDPDEALNVSVPAEPEATTKVVAAPKKTAPKKTEAAETK